MPTPTKGPRLGGSPKHERMMINQLCAQLFEHGRITTTETKAKRMRPYAEKLISKAKRGDVHARRLVLAQIPDKGVVHTLFTEIAPAVAEREGGYTRIVKIGNRKGDNAPMCVIELVTESVEDSRAAKEKAAKKAAPAKKAAATAAKPTKLVAAEPATEASPEVADKPVYEGSFRGAEAPEGYTIKGNEDSMMYHTPKSAYYESTIAEVWFESVEAAEKAGFKASKAEAKAQADAAEADKAEADDAQ